MKKYVIIPGCSDLNRGDQALAWETKKTMEAAGFHGQYYLTSEKNEPVEQSKVRGFKIISPVLEHPSRKFHNHNNMRYSKGLKIKWGVVSCFDLLLSMLLLWKPTRQVLFHFLDKDKQKTIQVMSESDGIFLKGGGLLQTYGGLTATYSMYFWTYPIFLANHLHKPIYVMPNSFGPFEGPLVKMIANRALKKCLVVTSRETISQRMVKNDLGLDISNFPDLAFSLPKSSISKETVINKFNLPLDKKLVAITMRPYRFPHAENSEEAYEKFKKEMANFIEWLFDSGYMPVLIVHTLAINEHEDDSACIREVTSTLSKKEYRLVSCENFDCEDLKSIYSFCDYVVGTRFHSVIFSISSGVPGIAIAYTGNKSQGIMHDIGLDDYVVNISDVSSMRLSKCFEKLLMNESEVNTKIRMYNEKVIKERKRLEQLCSKDKA
ncbi:polysaccharide pyruvyl transferase family protein [Lapidilactobacillus bayanensis]|uniref:polysaccharide pyruvyl transferase family protein n=1 Tax=Lapidilactobacillus bayanensis TaxID=2485998 RepID=UPI000F7B898B|nr:polysaccharide pyruvyl transferase family protein [Lapidilactobacillus bayanensis]